MSYVFKINRLEKNKSKINERRESNELQKQYIFKVNKSRVISWDKLVQFTNLKIYVKKKIRFGGQLVALTLIKG